MKLNVKTLLLLLTITLSIVSSNAFSTKKASRRSRALTKRNYAYAYATSKQSVGDFVTKLTAAFQDPNNYFKFVAGVISEPFEDLKLYYTEIEKAAPHLVSCFTSAFAPNGAEPALTAGIFGEMLEFAQKAYKWQDAIISTGSCIKKKFETAVLADLKNKLLRFFDAENILLQAGKIALNVVGNVFTFGILGAVKGGLGLADLIQEVVDFWKAPNVKTAFKMGAIVGKCIYMIFAFLGIGRRRKMKKMMKK